MKRSIFFAIIVIAAAIGGVVGSLFTIRFLDSMGSGAYQSIEERQRLILAGYKTDSSAHVPKELDFLAPAKRVTPGVVHIQTSYGPGDFSVNP